MAFTTGAIFQQPGIGCNRLEPVSDQDADLKAGGYYVARIDDAYKQLSDLHRQVADLQAEMKHRATRHFVVVTISSIAVGTIVAVAGIMTTIRFWPVG